MVTTSEQAEMRVDPQGRVVIPAALRRVLGLERGGVVVARVEKEKLVLEKREKILAKLQARFGVIPSRVGLADELIAERRLEARREDE